MATLDTILATIQTLNATAEALRLRVHPTPTPTPGTWTVQTPLSTNNNTVEYGQSVHNWTDSGVMGRLNTLGCKRFHGVWAYGPNRTDTFTIQDTFIRDARALGIRPSFSLLDPNYGTSTSQAPKLTALAAKYPGMAWTVGNEPPVSQSQYLAHLKMVYAALKAGDPTCIVTGPAATGIGLAWEQAFLALNPWPWLDAWNRHTYYGSPEENFGWLLNQVPQMVSNSAGRQVQLYIEEVGWALESTDQTGSGAVGFTEATRTNYASRYGFLAAGTRNLRALTLYAAIDEGQPQWGAYSAGWASIYPYAVAIRDAFAHIHLATGAANYKRNTSWFTRLNTPGGQRLAFWNPSGAHAETIFVNMPAAGALSVQTMGGTTATKFLAAGPQPVSFTAGQRAQVLYAPGASFPEFS